jgi:hypothetical protein
MYCFKTPLSELPAAIASELHKHEQQSHMKT